MTRKTAAIYARFSTDLQNDSSIDDQVALARRYADANGLDLHEALVFDDRAASGASAFGRVGLARMLESARDGDFEVLLIESMSRLARNVADSQGVFNELKFHDIELVEVSSGVTLDDTSAAFKGVFAQMQRDETAKMVRRGLDGVVRGGRSAGGRAYGCRSLPRHSHEQLCGGVLEIVESEAAIVREIFQRYADGETPRAIAHDLNGRGREASNGPRRVSTVMRSAAAGS